MGRLSIDAWRETRERIPWSEADAGARDLYEFAEPPEAMLKYDGGYWIADLGYGQYELTLGRDEWILYDLAELEEKLYEWAMDN